MQDYFEHPTEDALERFLLKQSPDTEIDVVETHLLACESCVARIEDLETQIAVTKIALTELQRSPELADASRKKSWKTWFTVPRLSLAGAMAALLLGVAAYLPAPVTLSAYRGAAVMTIPKWRPLQMNLNAVDLADGPVAVQLVNEEGTELWKGSGSVRHEHLQVRMPRIRKAGGYFLRLYASSDQAHTELLHEFAFQAK